MTAKRETARTRESLRQWLRNGDPLSEDVPQDEELRQLRARVLQAAGTQVAGTERRWSGFGVRVAFRPAMLTAIAILTLAAASILWFAGSSPSLPGSAHKIRAGSVSPQSPPTSQPSPPPVVAYGGVETAREASMQPARPTARPERVDGRTAVKTTRNRRVGEPAPGAGDEGPQKALQVQFTTPGGTRIIWVLNPDLALQPLQQEE